MPDMSHGQAHGMNPESMQGDRAPADARSGDYSDGIAASPAHALHLHGSTPAGMLLVDQLEAFQRRTAKHWNLCIDGSYLVMRV